MSINPSLLLFVVVFVVVGCGHSSVEEAAENVQQVDKATEVQKVEEGSKSKPEINKKRQLYSAVRGYVLQMKKRGPQSRNVQVKGPPGEKYARRNEAILNNGIPSVQITDYQVKIVWWIPEDAEVEIDHNDGWETAKFRFEQVTESTSRVLPKPLKKRAWGNWIPVWYSGHRWTFKDPAKGSFKLNE